MPARRVSECPARLSPVPRVDQPLFPSPLPQAEAVSRVDEQLRAEMVEAQAQLARWITEQKQIADTVTLQAQNTLDTDKGEPPARVREREREGESGGERQSHTTEGSLFPPPLRG